MGVMWPCICIVMDSRPNMRLIIRYGVKRGRNGDEEAVWRELFIRSF